MITASVANHVEALAGSAMEDAKAANGDAGSAVVNSPAISSLPEHVVESGFVLKHAHALVL